MKDLQQRDKWKREKEEIFREFCLDCVFLQRNFVLRYLTHFFVSGMLNSHEQSRSSIAYDLFASNDADSLETPPPFTSTLHLLWSVHLLHQLLFLLSRPGTEWDVYMITCRCSCRHLIHVDFQNWAWRLILDFKSRNESWLSVEEMSSWKFLKGQIQKLGNMLIGFPA